MDNFNLSITNIHKNSVIMVVEDDPTIRQMVVRAMNQEHYKVIAASNGEECLALYKKEVPDIVLIDAMMPVMDGFTCCQKLQEIFHKQSVNLLSTIPDEDINQADALLAAINRTPILMITGLDDSDSVNKAFELGAADYVTKPINWAVLKHRVSRLLHQSKLYQHLEQANNRLKQLANSDGLTHLANRRRFDEYLDQQWRLMARQKEPLSIILCDIDYFKAYNDTYGHQQGDFCLKIVARTISYTAQRPGDLAARYGGEEMALILPNTDTNGALHIAHKIRNSLHEASLPHEKSGLESNKIITLSMGVASCIPELDADYEELVELADRHLYQAKDRGRDQIVSG